LPKKSHPKSSPAYDFWWKVVLVWFFASILFQLVECDPLDNTLGGRNLAFFSSAIGIALSVMVAGFLFAFDIESADITPPLLVYGILALTFTMTSVAGASSLNRNLSKAKTYQARFKVIGKGFSFTKSRSYYLDFVSSYGKERVVVRKAFYQSMPIGSTLRFTLRDGLFGYPVITKIDKQPQN
jgi:hypothetical protein